MYHLQIRHLNISSIVLAPPTEKQLRDAAAAEVAVHGLYGNDDLNDKSSRKRKHMNADEKAKQKWDPRYHTFIQNYLSAIDEIYQFVYQFHLYLHIPVVFRYLSIVHSTRWFRIPLNVSHLIKILLILFQ